MNSRQLEYVVVVSETLSFSEAAKQLYISQPSLSQYIKKVEKEIGAEIFTRTTPLRLTYEGEVFVRYAKMVLDEEKHLETIMSDISNNELGALKIGAGPLNSATVLPNVLDKFSVEYPNIEIILSESIETDLIKQLESGEVDILLTVINPKNEEGFIIEEVSREQYILAVPKVIDVNDKEYKKLLKKNDNEMPVINILKCRDLPYIMQSQFMPAHILFEDLCRKNGFVPYSRFTCKNINTAIGLAGKGLGACIIPSSIVDEIPAQFNYYKIEENYSKRIINIIYRRGMKLTKIHNAFINEIKKYYK